jgi:hypothetical protein
LWCGGVEFQKKEEAMEVVKLSIKLGSPEEQRAIAITADGKHHSYGQLLQSAFKLSSSLLQSAQPTRDATSDDDGQLAASVHADGAAAGVAKLVPKVNLLASLSFC